jgi:nicotinamidase-related amidase
MTRRCALGRSRVHRAARTLMVARSTATALLVLDMVSEFRFPDAARVLRGARRPARTIARLKARARAASVPVIYVNDTAGKWESDPRAFVQRCLASDAQGRDVVGLVKPDLERDYFMFKPKHSAFFGTPLEPLLERLGVRRLVLTGMTSHQCVLFTAMDAHVREYELIVPADCVAAGSREETRHALFIAARALRARTTASTRLRF